MKSASDCILELQDVRFRYRQRESFFRHSDFEALRGISLAVQRGETIGVLGPNGCGKSTLLKVVAGIYEPDGGTIHRHCKKVSLLSLALGFDPSLTGRENAIISGMLSGSTRQEVDAELEEILAFAELGDFIDKPIKTYSSGMRTRLGFSVALKLKTDLMLLDEVLSVGDVRFRQKAERAMIDRISSEQTVIMVSHSLAQIRNLSSRIVWIEQGRIRAQGDPEDMIEQYKKEMGV